MRHIPTDSHTLRSLSSLVTQDLFAFSSFQRPELRVSSMSRETKVVLGTGTRKSTHRILRRTVSIMVGKYEHNPPIGFLSAATSYCSEGPIFYLSFSFIIFFYHSICAGFNLPIYKAARRIVE